MEDKKTQIYRLVEELNRASEAYYNGQSEQMTDYEWDAKFDELKRLEGETGLTLPDSPTQKVSEDNIAGQKEEHEFPALSLAKTKSIDEVVKWADGKPIWISWKLDGLTLVATYDDGRLQRLVTRGNGHIGTNITHLSAAINGIPQRISYKGHLVVRGEAVISYQDFDNYLIESGEDYANPRNLASGTMTLKDIAEVRRRNVTWIPFTLVHADENALADTGNGSAAVLQSWGSRMSWLETVGFKCVEREVVETPVYNNVEAVINRFTDKVTSKANPYPVDGLVVTYDDTAFASSGSITGHHATRAGLAFKWQDEAAETTLEHIEWSCAANTISPVAVFLPVELEGTTVKRASLCNISECERLGIGGEGTRMLVIKANKIIPKVISIEEKKGTLTIPETCPVCGHPTTINVSEGSGTKTLHCQNPQCAAKELKKFARFVSKEGMNIDGLSEQTLSRIINEGWVREYADIYHLNDYAWQMSALEGFGERSVGKLLEAIRSSRNVEAHRLLYALNIPLCGIDVCKRLLSAYKYDELTETAHSADDAEHFSHIDGIGAEKSSSFINWMKDDTNYDKLQRLVAELNITQEQPVAKGGKCEGLTFVITGDVHHYKNRNELKAYIESQGGKVTGSVSKSTSFLINNDVTSESGKNKKAKELGIPIISEDEFVSRYADSQPVQTDLFG
ncbi:MAG: NAD-dependent DNA ligase LigA [Prevotella sp.]|nr:NAD-dependent DNA ligase LigA [Prevotella sp.]